MKRKFFSVGERFVVLGALQNRRDLVDQMLIVLDPEDEHDAHLIEWYRVELSCLVSALNKLSYDEK